jgi:PEP-CTERM motif
MGGFEISLKFLISSVVLLLLLLVCAAPKAFASGSGASVEASCGVQLDFGPTSSQPFNSSSPGSIPPLNCASTGFSQDFYGPGQDARTSASASTNGSIGFGAVGVNLTTKASSTPLIDGAEANASVNASWFDTLAITGPFQGDPVQFRLTASIAGSMTCNGETAGNVFYQVSWGQATTISFSDDNCSNKLAGTQNAVITVSVGQQLVIGGEILSTARAIAGNCCSPSEQDVSAGDTFSLFITPLTPGASYTSASGTDYASAVPEPSSLLLAATGLAVFYALSFRRRESRGERPGPAAAAFRRPLDGAEMT